jgi:uncharacterized protein YdiU (UPF0061 family)
LTSTESAAAQAARDPGFEAWHARLLARRTRQPQPHVEAEDLMQRHNPAVIPRNHKVEEALEAAAANDLSAFNQLLEILRTPYAHSLVEPEYSTPPPTALPYRTFCGT